MEQLGKLREEEESATELRREYTDLGKREEQVACHGPALVLAMIGGACQEAEIMTDDLYRFDELQQKPYNFH